MKNVCRVPMSFRSIVSTALATAGAFAILLLDASPARAQGARTQPFECLTYSLSASLPAGSTPFLRQAPPAGCAVPLSPLPVAVQAIVPASAPTGLAASVDGQTVSLTWNAGSGAVRSYLVYAGTSSGVVNVARFDTESDSPTLTVTDVPPGTYFFRVAAQTDNGLSAPSNEASARVGVLGVSRFTTRCIYTTPADATALTVNYLPGNVLNFTWRAPELGDCQALFPATGYLLEYSTAPGGPKIALQLYDLVRDLRNTTSLNLPYGSITGTFYVWIRSCGSTGCGPASNEVILNLGTTGGAPSAPANLIGTAIGNTLALVWDEVSAVSSRATGYAITVTPAINGSNRLGSGAPLSQGGKTFGLYRATGIPKGTYTFQVQGINTAGLGPLSTAVTVTLDGPSSPVRVAALHSFTGAANDGANWSTLTNGRHDLEQFGTASSGGPKNSRCVQDRDGCGIVFKFLPLQNPDLIILGTFGTGAAPGSGNPPTYPRSTPFLANDGFLWGTTNGQEFTNPNGGGAAVVYKVSPNGGGITIVAELGGPAPGRVIQASNGRIYGTTSSNGPGACAYRGTNCTPTAGSGTVWYVPTSGGPATYIKTFTGTDGASPYGGLLQGADGMLYGMTAGGGAFGLGTIYRINPADNSFTKLYDFPGGAGGAQPLGDLMQVGSVFYGVTFCGGDQSNTPTWCAGTDGNGTAGGKGTIFSMTVSGNTATVTTLRRLTGRLQATGENELTQAYDGILPTANLVDGRDGRLYGVANGGGPWGGGIAFSIKYDGSGYTVLHAFDGNASGSPNATLVYLATYGVFLGVGQYGGGFNYGSIFYMFAPTGY